MAKIETPKTVALRASGGNRTLRVGLVSVGIGMAPALDESSRVAGKLLDPVLLTPLAQQLVNAEGEVVARSNAVKGYAYDDRFIVLDPSEVPTVDGDGTIDLVANIEAADLPSEWIDKTYIAWPSNTTHDTAYALVAGYLRDSGRVLIGTTVANGTTKVLAIRWSVQYGSLVAQLLAYHSQVRWGNVQTCMAGVASIPDPDAAMVTMAAAMLDAIPAEFAWDAVVDEYGEALEAAILEKATNGAVTVAPAVKAESVAVDLMAALKASQPAADTAPKTTRKAKVS